MNEREKMRAEQLAVHSGPQALSIVDLVRQIACDAKSLAKMQVELAKAEAKVDVNSELDLAKGAGVAVVCGILGLNMIIIAVVFALAPRWAWLVAFIVGIVLLCIGAAAAILGWRRAEKNPLADTRESLKEDMRWAKQQLK